MGRGRDEIVRIDAHNVEVAAVGKVGCNDGETGKVLHLQYGEIGQYTHPLWHLQIIRIIQVVTSLHGNMYTHVHTYVCVCLIENLECATLCTTMHQLSGEDGEKLDGNLTEVICRDTTS